MAWNINMAIIQYHDITNHHNNF